MRILYRFASRGAQRCITRVLTIGAILLACWPVRASEPLRLGRVNFPVSCAASVQQAFSVGVAFLHSFQYAEATKTFGDIAKRDPGCGMAYWGLATSLYQQLWKWPTASDLQKGREYAVEGEKLGGKTNREREYIAAIAAFYRERPNSDRANRIKAFSRALQKLYRDNPTDINAGRSTLCHLLL